MTNPILHQYLSSETPHSLNAGDIPGHEIIKKAFQEYGSTYSWEADCMFLLPGRETWLQIKKKIPDFLEKFGYGPDVFVGAPEFTHPKFGQSSGKLLVSIKWQEPDSERIRIRNLMPTKGDIFTREAGGKNFNTRDLSSLEPAFSLFASFQARHHDLPNNADTRIKEEFEKFASCGFSLSLDSWKMDQSPEITNIVFKLLSWIGKKCDASLIIYDEAGTLRPFFYYDHTKDTWHYKF